VMAVRSLITGNLRGLEQVNTTLGVYLPDPEVNSWVGLNYHYFMEPTDVRLIPRGMLLHGVPGTGKSQASKYVARSYGVPLYRLDLSASLSKWVGDSEANFTRSLTTLDHEEPCVLLIDEVEKVFSTKSDDAGVTPRILSQLLWWLQEHTSRVLTIMTTNDLQILPEELYRKGRIDKVIELKPLAKSEAVTLLTQTLDSFIPDKRLAAKHRTTLINKLYPKSQGRVSHVNVVQSVYDLIKEMGLLTNGKNRV